MIPRKLLPPSPEQLRFLLGSTARQNWAHGPVRSGKNHVLNIRFAELLATWPKGNEDSDVYLGGKTKDTVERIFLRDLFSWVGEGNYTHNKSKGKGTISLKWPGGGRFTREFYCFGYSDADSHEAISGATIGLAYLTEGIFCHEDFHKQLVARLSIDEGNSYSLLLGDTNPAGPGHWLWKKVINNPDLLSSDNVRAFLFNFYSNPSLSEGKREELRIQYGPGSLWYKRQIEGLWVMAEGIIYAMMFDEKRNSCRPDDLPTEFDELSCSLDYGTTNTFVFGLWGSFGGKDYLIDAYVYNSLTGDKDGKRGDKTNAQYLSDILDFLKPYIRFYRQRITEVIVDPSAASFKAELEDWSTDDSLHNEWRSLGIKVTDAENDVEEGIKTMANRLYMGLVIICTRVELFFDEVGMYAWDSKAQEKGEDKPIKKNDHCMDMVRYYLHTRIKRVDHYAAWR